MNILLLEVGDVFKEGDELYVVYRAEMNGGGTGHGPHDVYPDGWHVYAQPLQRDSTSEPISFYQSGCFSMMRPPGSVPVLAKARAIWEVTHWVHQP